MKWIRIWAGARWRRGVLRFIVYPEFMQRFLRTRTYHISPKRWKNVSDRPYRKANDSRSLAALRTHSCAIEASQLHPGTFNNLIICFTLFLQPILRDDTPVGVLFFAQTPLAPGFAAECQHQC